MLHERIGLGGGRSHRYTVVMLPLRRLSVLFSFGVLLFLPACQGEEVAQCRQRYLEALPVVSQVNTSELESVEQALGVVDPTLELCQRAKLSQEVDQLTNVKRRLDSHHGYLKRMQTKKPLTEVELARLVKDGDPSCPRGSAYKYDKSEQQIRCTGPQIVDMNWKQAQDYFTHRGFTLRENGNELRAESGSVSYTYTFSRPGDAAAASCLVVFSEPGIAWEETASRLSGVPPRRLVRDAPLETKSGKKPMAIEEQEIQAVLKIGECG